MLVAGAPVPLPRRLFALQKGVKSQKLSVISIDNKAWKLLKDRARQPFNNEQSEMLLDGAIKSLQEEHTCQGLQQGDESGTQTRCCQLGDAILWLMARPAHGHAVAMGLLRVPENLVPENL